MLPVSKVVLFGPLCGRWYVTPIFKDGTRGGATGFDSRIDAELHQKKSFPSAVVLRGGDSAYGYEQHWLRKVTG